MAGPLGKFVKSLVYAGLEPASHGGAAPRRGRVRRLWDRLLTGGPSPSDPLYLTNRTWKQKLRVALVASTPVLIVLGVAAWAMLAPPQAVDKPASQPSPAEIAARTAILPKDFTLPQNTDLQVTDVTVEKTAGACFVVGTLRNNTARRFAGADLSLDLTDETGSQVGAVSTRAEAIEPNASAVFRFAIPQRRATFVLVREVHGLP